MRTALLAVAVTTASFSPAAAPARADAPLPPPERSTLCSPSRLFCVTTDPSEGTWAHHPGRGLRTEALWSVPRWFRRLWLADDPELLVTGYDGGELVPLRSPGATEVLTFWRHGRPLRVWRLAELIDDLGRLDRTASHYRWGGYLGFDAEGRFRVRTVEGQELVFDPATGTIVATLPAARE